MNTKNISIHKKDHELLLPLLVSVSVTLFLFYIDEGYYNFNWMRFSVNWIAFFIYTALLFAGQWLSVNFLFPRKPGRFLILARYGIGILTALILAFTLFNAS